MNTAKEKPDVRYLLLCTFIYWLSLYLYVPILPSFTERLGGAFSTVGLVIGSYGLVQLLLRVPTGLLSDKMGRRKPFVILGFLMCSLGGFGMGQAATPITLGIFRAVTGIAATMWVPFTVMISSRFAQGGTTSAMGYLNLTMSLGLMIGTLSGGWLAGMYGLRFPFLLAGIVGLVGAGAILKVKEEPIHKEESFSFLLNVKRVLVVPSLVVASLMAALSQYGTWVTAYGFTPIYAERLGATEFQLGLLILVALMPQALAAMLVGTGGNRLLGAWAMVMVGFTLSGISILLLPFFPSIAALYVLQAIGGFGRGLVMPCLMGLCISQVGPGERATAMGVFQAVYALGMFLGPVVSGFLGSRLDFAGIFVFTGIVTLASLGVAVIGGRWIRVRQETPS